MRRSLLKKLSWRLSALIALGVGLVWLSACTPTTRDAPCDAYGQHCDPKIPINQ